MQIVKRIRKILSVTLAFAMLTGTFLSISASAEENTSENTLARIDNTKWLYNSDDDVYYQVGIQYCSNPADLTYETLGIYVPGAYMDAADNGDGTFTCTVNSENEVSGYTASTAPIVLPVNTPGYSAMEAPTGYTSVSSYTNAGFVYLYAGCRGRDEGAPAGVTDLKAAIKYIRYCADLIPGNTDRIFSFGMSGGGAQSALLGSTGDAAEYTEYLNAIGAVTGYSDAVLGSMCWCPITNLDTADEAYEWNMGSARTDLDDDTQAISDALASAYAEYINALGLTDSEGNVLTLEESEEGIYQAGSYYEYIKSVIEESLNNFLADTTWPYTPSSSGGTGMMGGDGPKGEKPDGDLPDGEKPSGDLPNGEVPSGDLPNDKKPSGDLPDGEAQSGDLPDADASVTDSAVSSESSELTQEEIYAEDGVKRNDSSTDSDSTGSTTYETAADYIAYLNESAGEDWVTYDEATNTATITSIAAFVKSQKSPSKDVGAFDDLDTSQAENTLFGYADGNGAHFDSTLANILTQLGSSYADSYAADLEKTDSLGNTVDERLAMYTPLYYLSEYYDGFGTSTVATYWRIRTGISQGDTALNTEVNLTLALEALGRDVDFATVWGQGHTQAERTGSSDENFIEWVNECLAGEE